MRSLLYACTVLFFVSAGESAFAQSSAGGETSADRNAIPISRLIAAVANRTSKKFVLDARVQAQVSILGQDPAAVSYNDLLLILKVYGFAAIETGGYVWVAPDAIARHMANPVVSGSDRYPDAQYVTKVITVRNMPAAMLVPLLRPMLPQQGHLAAVTCTNTLIMVDTFDNVRRIESLVKSVDTGEPYKVPKCELPQPPAQRSPVQGATD